MTKYLKWADRVDAIAGMANQGMTDGQIGEKLGASGQMIYAVRAHYGIPTNSTAGGFRKRAPLPAPLPPPVLPVVNGVKQCPTRWLEGCAPGPTARPRR